jgi:hypothetical protein
VTTTLIRRPTTLWRVLFAVAVLVNLTVVYIPQAPGTGAIPYADKIVHLAIFAAVAFTGRAAGVPRNVLLGVLIVQAVGSEVLQATLLPHRSGDPWDSVADIAGALLGWVAARPRARDRGSMGS